MAHVPSWWQAAVLPTRWDVCGIPCSALSVWHVYALCETGNAYLCGGPRDRDAAAGLLLFAMTDYNGGRRYFRDPLYRARRMRYVARALRRVKWETIDAACNDYVEACRRVPQHKEPAQVPGKSAGRSVAAPMPWILVSYIGQGGKYESAWNMPYAHARCLFDARRDVSGEDDTLESRAEEARYDAMQAAKGGN